MFSIIYHAGAAVLFLVMSLAAGAGLLLHGHEVLGLAGDAAVGRGRVDDRHRQPVGRDHLRPCAVAF